MTPLPILLLALVGFSLGISARKSFTTHRAEVLGVIRAWNWRYFPGTLAALAGTFAVAAALDEFLPWTRWGWWHLLGGHGNPVLGQVNLGSSVYALGVSTILAVTFPLLFAAAAIREARREEVDYRKGNQKRTLAWRARRALWFGIIHSISGIPIYAGIAISVMGAWFDYVYQRGYKLAAKQAVKSDAQSQPLSARQLRNARIAIRAANEKASSPAAPWNTLEEWAAQAGTVTEKIEREMTIQMMSDESGEWSTLEEWAAQAGTASDKIEREMMIKIMRDETRDTDTGMSSSTACVDAVRGDLLAVLRARLGTLVLDAETIANDRAEEAGVNAAAAQHAAINLLLIVVIECFVLSDLGVI